MSNNHLATQFYGVLSAELRRQSIPFAHLSAKNFEDRSLEICVVFDWNYIQDIQYLSIDWINRQLLPHVTLEQYATGYVTRYIQTLRTSAQYDLDEMDRILSHRVRYLPTYIDFIEKRYAIARRILETLPKTSQPSRNEHRAS